MRLLLWISVKDMSSGFRLYRREALQQLDIQARNFEAVEEVLVKAHAQGYRVREVPFTYFPREHGKSHARLLTFGSDLVRTSLRLRKLRTSVMSADSDDRAFYSIKPIRRYRQRRRHRLATNWARGATRVLDIGCGSGRIIQSLHNAIGLDLDISKLRFLRGRGITLLCGSAAALPFKDGSFDCLVSSEVIEYLPLDEVLFEEMYRLLQPGGTLVIGTLDHDALLWRLLEPVYRLLISKSCKKRAITRYTRKSLTEILARQGFNVEETAYVLKSEVIIRLRKPEAKACSAKPPTENSRLMVSAA
jgi:SAM-dependent methyltransferase